MSSNLFRNINQQNAFPHHTYLICVYKQDFVLNNQQYYMKPNKRNLTPFNIDFTLG